MPERQPYVPPPDSDRTQLFTDARKAQEKEYDDCLPCRLMGSAAFTGLGIYTYASGRKQLKERRKEILRSGSWVTMGMRQSGILGLSALLVGVGAYRLTNGEIPTFRLFKS